MNSLNVCDERAVVVDVKEEDWEGGIYWPAKDVVD